MAMHHICCSSSVVRRIRNDQLWNALSIKGVNYYNARKSDRQSCKVHHKIVSKRNRYFTYFGELCSLWLEMQDVRCRMHSSHHHPPCGGGPIDIDGYRVSILRTQNKQFRRRIENIFFFQSSSKNEWKEKSNFKCLWLWLCGWAVGTGLSLLVSATHDYL